VRCLQPAAIVPTHYDNFFQPLGEPSQFSFNVNLTGFADEVTAVSRSLPIRTLEIGVPL
jgi:hypothetical protein